MAYGLLGSVQYSRAMKNVALLMVAFTCVSFISAESSDAVKCSKKCVMSSLKTFDFACCSSRLEKCLLAIYSTRSMISAGIGDTEKCPLVEESTTNSLLTSKEKEYCLTYSCYFNRYTCTDQNPRTKNDRCVTVNAGIDCVGEPYSCEKCMKQNGIGCVLPRDTCKIGDNCVAAYERKLTECQICDPCLSTTSYTKLSGVSCDDKDKNTKDDECKDGKCVGVHYTCSSECEYPNGKECKLSPNSCLIDSTCYENNQRNPKQDCQICKSSSPNSWTAQTNGNCNDGDSCTYNDVCTKEGLCKGEDVKPERCTEPCLKCDGTATCALTKGCFIASTNKCGCHINGHCFQNGQVNPSNKCMYCDTSRNVSGWSAFEDGRICTDSNSCTRNDRCHGGNCIGEDFLKECHDLKENACVQEHTCNGTNCVPKYYDKQRQCHKQLDACDYPDIKCSGSSPTCDYCTQTGCVAVKKGSVKQAPLVDVEKAKVKIYDSLSTDGSLFLPPREGRSGNLFYMVPSKTKLRLMFEQFKTTCGDVTLDWSLQEQGRSDSVFSQSVTTNSSGTKIVVVRSLNLQDQKSYYLLVKAKNVRHKVTNYKLDHPIFVDTTPPKVGKVYDGNLAINGVNQDIIYQSEDRIISANWNLSEFRDDESELLNFKDDSPFWMAVGTARGKSDVHSYTLIKTGKTEGEGRLHLDTNLKTGLKYYASIKVFNQAGLFSTSSSNGVIIDTSAPIFCSQFILVNNQSNTRRLILQIAPSRQFFVRLCVKDEESGADPITYTVCEGTRGCVIVPRTKNCTDCVEAVQVTQNSHLLDDDIFHNGGHYWVMVTVRNGAGLRSNSTSQSVNVDYNPPKKGKVYDGFKNYVDAVYQKETQMLGVSWKDFGGEGSPHLAYCETAAFNLSKQLTGNVKSDTTTSGWSRIRYKLIDGRQYFVSVRCYDIVGRSVTAMTNGVAIDSKPPKLPRLMIDLRYEDDTSEDDAENVVDRDYQVSLEGLRTKWSTFEAASGIASCSWNLTTKKNKEDVIATREVNCTSACAYKYVGKLDVGVTYVASVECTSHVGLSTTAETDGITPVSRNDVPLVGKVYDLCPDECNVPGDIDSSSSPYKIKFSWEAFTDATSGIDYYEWSLLLNCTVISTVYHSMKVGGQATSVAKTFTHPLGVRRYCVVVTAYNGAGLSASSTSDGVTIDVTPPTATIVKDGENPVADIDYQYSDSNFSFTWERITDPETGIESLEVGIGDRTANGVVEMHSVENDLTSYAMHGLHLEENHVYYGRVCATNGARNKVCFESDGCLIDRTPPTEGVVMIGLVPPGLRYQTTDKSISAHWYGMIDNESSIDRFEWAIGTSTKEPDLLPFTSVGTNVSRTEYIQLTSGQTYFVFVMAFNRENLPRLEKSEGVLVDISPPVIPSHAVNLSFSGSNRMKVEWADFVDDESGLLYYKWAIGFTKYGSQVQRYTCVGRETSVLSHAVTLVLGRRYFAAVEGRNKAGLSSIATSEGHVYDTTAPPLFNVFDGNSSQRDIDYQSSNSSLTMTWVDSEGGASAVRAYYAGVGTNNCTDDVEKFMLVPPESKHLYTFSALSLREGKPYFSLVKCENEAGIFSIASSNGVIIDGTRPQAGSVFTRPYQSSDSIIIAQWSGFRDEESGIDKYYISITSQSPSNRILHNCEDVGLTDEATVSDLSLDNGAKYFVNVKAVNKAGLYIIVSSSGVTVDKSAPIAGVVFDGVGEADNDSDDDWLQTVTGFGAHWKNFKDFESGIAYYRWFIGTYPGGCTVLSAVNVSKQTTARCSSCSFVPGVRYYVTVEATNGAGLTTRAHSDGFVVDISKPVVRDFSDVKWKKNNLLQFRWKGAFDNESGPPKCFVSLVSSDSSKRSAKFEAVNKSLVTSDEHIIQVEILSKLDESSMTLHLFIGCVNKAGCFASSLRNETVYWILPKRVSVTLLTFSKNSVSFRWKATLSQSQHSWVDAIRLKVSFENKSLIREETFWPTNDAPLSVSFPEFTLSYGNVCTVLSTAISYSGLNSPATVQTFVLPLASAPLRDADCCFLSIRLVDIDALSINWNWKNGLDEKSEELGYEYSYAIGTVPGGGQIRRYTNVGRKREVLCSDIALPYGRNYFVSIRASMDKFKSFIAYQSEGIFSDPTPPISGQVATESFFALNTPFSVSWKGFRDQESGISDCTVSLLEASTKQIAWTSNGSLPSHGAGNLTGIDVSTWSQGSTYFASVRCSNGVGKFAQSVSGTFVVDDTKPVVGSIFVGTFDGIHMASNKLNISASWSGFFDEESGIVRYEWTVGKAGASTILDVQELMPMFDVGVKTMITAVVSISNQGLYRLFVRATNGAGLQSTAKSGELVYDMSPPRGPLSVIDGLGNDDIDYQSSVILSSSWGEVLDAESGIRQCLWYIGSDPGGAQVMSPKPVPVSTSERCLDCKPSQGTRYYSTLMCINGVGLNTTVSSDGVLVDFTPPIVGRVYSGRNRTDVRYTMNTSAFECSWEKFLEEESGVEEYFVCLSTVPGKCNVYGSIATKGLTRWSFRSLTLRHLQTYYCSVSALNKAKLRSHSSSDGVLVDVTPPVAGTVNDGIKDDVDCLASNDSVAANWFNFFDSDSGIAEYRWGIGTTKGSDDVLKFSSVGVEQAVVKKIELPETKTIFVTVICVNKAGGSIRATSNGMKIVSPASDIEGLGCVVL